MSQPFQVSVVRREVTWRLPTLAYIVDANKPYFLALKMQQTREQVQAWAVEFLQEASREIATFGQPGEMITRELEFLQLDDGLRFWPYLSPAKVPVPHDPINVVFWKSAAPGAVLNLLCETVGRWNEGRGATMFALIDDTEHGGTVAWKRQDAHARDGNFFMKSHHLRLFDGREVCQHGKGQYSIGATHYEGWNPIRFHKPLSWDDSRAHIAGQLGDVPDKLGSLHEDSLGPPMVLQSLPTDGRCFYVEML